MRPLPSRFALPPRRPAPVTTSPDYPLPYRRRGAPDGYDKGAPLPGETPDAPISNTAGRRRVLPALGFVVEGPAGWLARGAQWDAQWPDPDPETQPGAPARLRVGPLRQRIAALEEALADDLGADE